VIEIDEGIDRPQSLLYFFASDHLARLLQQERQNLKRLFLQLYLRTVAAQLARPQVNLKSPELNGTRPIRAGNRHVPHLQCPQFIKMRASRSE
jgi:hypothetical protein